MKSIAGRLSRITEITFVPHIVTDPLLFRRSVPARFFVNAIKSFLRGLFKVCFRLDVFGREKIPTSGPFLICPNHLSDIDPLLLYSLLPEDTLYIAYERNFRHAPLSWIIRYGRVLLTTRGGKTPRCLIRAYQGLQQGFSVCLFPEGGRTTSGSLLEPRDGAAILSKQANIPILPVFIEGSENLLSPVRPGFRFCKIKIAFGDPIEPAAADPAELLQNWKRAIVQLQQEVNS
ncbi:MAG: lysophospholipid acyltransferase family protein [Acidobacteriota bacterium]